MDRIENVTQVTQDRRPNGATIGWLTVAAALAGIGVAALIKLRERKCSGLSVDSVLKQCDSAIQALEKRTFDTA